MTRPGLNNRVARLERQRAEAEQLGAEILEWLATATPDEVTEVARFLRERIPPFGQPAPYVDEETARFNALPPAARRQASSTSPNP